METSKVTQDYLSKQVAQYGKDSLSARNRISFLRFMIGGKKKEISKTRNPRLIVAMNADIILWEREIKALVKAQPKALGFRDMVDFAMDKGGVA